MEQLLDRVSLGVGSDEHDGATHSTRAPSPCELRPHHDAFGTDRDEHREGDDHVPAALDLHLDDDARQGEEHGAAHDAVREPACLVDAPGEESRGVEPSTAEREDPPGQGDDDDLCVLAPPARHRVAVQVDEGTGGQRGGEDDGREIDLHEHETGVVRAEDDRGLRHGARGCGSLPRGRFARCGPYGSRCEILRRPVSSPRLAATPTRSRLVPRAFAYHLSGRLPGGVTSESCREAHGPPSTTTERISDRGS